MQLLGPTITSGNGARGNQRGWEVADLCGGEFRTWDGR